MTPSPPDPRIVAAAQADDVRALCGMDRKHSPEHYARLIAGEIHPADDAPSPGLTAWVIVFAAIVIVAAIGVMTLPATPAPYTGPGFENCRGRC